MRIRDDTIASIMFFGQIVVLCAGALIWMTHGPTHLVAGIFSVGGSISYLITRRQRWIACHATPSDASEPLVPR